MFAEAEAAVLVAAFPAAATLQRALRRREAGELIEHIVGEAHFHGLRLELDRGVFVPRPRAEPLAVRAAVEAGRQWVGARVLDLACGSGAIAAVIAQSCPGAEVVATDVSAPAVATARRNGSRFGFAAYESDWFGGLPDRFTAAFDVVVAYLPHTPDRALSTLARDRIEGEGLESFAGGPDGLDPLRAVLRRLPGWLAPGGTFVTLVAGEQTGAATDVAVRAGWAWAAATDTPHGNTVVALTRPT